MKTQSDLIRWLDENQHRFTAMADTIWATPEIAWQEFESSKLQADFFADEGFTVWSIADIPTAFIAEWGEGNPVIGFVGEYDALPGLSQKCQPTQEPLEDGGPGHGCGHNLLGTGAVASALAIKEWLEATGTPGTVRYYGCPAEEQGSGKAYMARAGTFDDLDVAFNFHPSSVNIAMKARSVGVYDARFRFYGRTAHAGGSPHLGRSALDAVELMNIGVNYLREHVLPTNRMHYVITKGGEAPNIVPDFAEVWYFLRALEPSELESLTDRVRKIADGAALMTGTRVEEVFGSSCAVVLNNHYLADLQYEVLKEIGPIQFTDEEYAYAQKVNDEFPPEVLQNTIKKFELSEELAGKPLIAECLPPYDANKVWTGSSDVGDVSWCTPVAMLRTACFSTGTPGHSWGNVATGGMSIGHKGMMHAAKVMAVAAMRCYTDPSHIQKAREEFQQATQGHPYQTLIPDEIGKPRIAHASPPGSLPERYPQCPFYKSVNR